MDTNNTHMANDIIPDAAAAVAEVAPQLHAATPVVAATNAASSTTVGATAASATIKIIFSAPASPAAAPTTPTPESSPPSVPHAAAAAAAANYSPASGDTPSGSSRSSNAAHSQSHPHSYPAPPPPPQAHSVLSTPKKNFLDAVMLQTIREKLKTPGRGGTCEQHSDIIATTTFINCGETVNVIKDRYLISPQPSEISAAAAAKSPVSYRHLIDLSASNLRCTDVFTEEQFLCKIINEPIEKVQRAYFQLQQDVEHRSSIFGHTLIRGVHDIVPLSKHRTYVIIAMPKELAAGFDYDEDEEVDGVYEDLHTYIRNKRRLCETEARALFHQICQTVQVCHRNGIILRDLKLKRFYFVDLLRTKLQYESLEGSMILDNPGDDTLSDKIGCPLYTAPELLCPTPTYRGKPADMWSLGVILYTMLVGQYPFYEKGNCNLITIIRHCHVVVPGVLSRSVRWLILGLLRKNYEERIESQFIFQSHWLKQQRPFYMYIPFDVIMPEDECELMQKIDNECQLKLVDLMACEGMEPLDYTRQALRMEFQEMDDDGDDEREEDEEEEEEDEEEEEEEEDEEENGEEEVEEEDEYEEEDDNDNDVDMG